MNGIEHFTVLGGGSENLKLNCRESRHKVKHTSLDVKAVLLRERGKIENTRRSQSHNQETKGTAVDVKFPPHRWNHHPGLDPPVGKHRSEAGQVPVYILKRTGRRRPLAGTESDISRSSVPSCCF